MSSKNFPFAFATLALGGLSLAALAVSQTGSPALEPQPEDLKPAAEIAEQVPLCALGTEVTNRGAILSASVTPDTTLVGSFNLTVVRSSGGNRASIRQGGAFEAAAGKTTTLSLSSFNSTDGLDAELTLKVGGKTIDCPFNDYPQDS